VRARPRVVVADHARPRRVSLDLRRGAQSSVHTWGLAPPRVREQARRADRGGSDGRQRQRCVRTGHDRFDSRTLAHAPVLGTLGRALQRRRLRDACTGLAGDGGRSRGAAPRSIGHERSRSDRSCGSLRAADPQARLVPDHHGTLVRRLDHADLVGSRPRLRGHRGSPGADQGRQAAPDLELAFVDAGAEEPREPQDQAWIAPSNGSTPSRTP
jgi:hypothetical protein